MAASSRIGLPVLGAISARITSPVAGSTVMMQTPLPVMRFARAAYGYSGRGADIATAFVDSAAFEWIVADSKSRRTKVKRGRGMQFIVAKPLLTLLPLSIFTVMAWPVECAKSDGRWTQIDGPATLGTGWTVRQGPKNTSDTLKMETMSKAAESTNMNAGSGK